MASSGFWLSPDQAILFFIEKLKKQYPYRNVPEYFLSLPKKQVRYLLGFWPASIPFLSKLDVLHCGPSVQGVGKQGRQLAYALDWATKI